MWDVKIIREGGIMRGNERMEGGRVGKGRREMLREELYRSEGLM